MKNILCYLGIIILLGLILLPPILRIVLPDKEKIEIVEKIEYINLSCNNDEYLTNTSYTNDKINMIIIKKFNQVEQNSNTGEEFIQIFESLKDKSTVVHTVSEDGEVLTIDFSLSDNKGLNIAKLTKNASEQKEFYESQKLTCITKNL